MHVSDYGCTIQKLVFIDKKGNPVDIHLTTLIYFLMFKIAYFVVLGLNTIEEYEKLSPYFGCVIGRTFSKFKNGRIEIDGEKIVLKGE